MMSAFVGLARYGMPRTTILVDGRVAHEGPLTLAAVSNGRSFAGGMRVAPGASIDDGLFDIVMTEGMSVPRALLLFPNLMAGRHVRNRRVHVQRGKVVRAESEATVWVEADGEVAGTLPCTFEILPGALTLCGLPSS
jgi:diacylglycerol kinase (ATP)